MVLTSGYEEILTVRQSRYLSAGLSTFSYGDEACAGGRQLVRRYQLLLRAAQAWRHVPAVHVRPARERSEREAGALQVVAHERDGMQVVAKRPDQHVRGVLVLAAGQLALVDPPRRGALVKAGDVELLDHHRAAVAEKLPEALQRVAERLDVMERDHGDRGVEGAIRLVELVQVHLHDVTGGSARGIDREHVVPEPAQLLRELTLARTDLEHARGRGGQRARDETENVVVCHLVQV